MQNRSWIDGARLPEAHAGFDTRDPGTPEIGWRDLLGRVADVRIIRLPILIVAPHPDDEVFGAGGLQVLYPQARVVVVTDGEAACPGDINLAGVRRREVTAAQRCLGIRRVAPAFLGLPDGRLCSQEHQLERLLTSRLQDVATLIAPFERDGHPDHDAVGRVCVRLARRYRFKLLRYMIWGWHQQQVAAFRSGQFVKLRLDERAQRAKRRAIACFGSQIRGGSEAVVPPHVLEYFRRPYETFLK